MGMHFPFSFIAKRVDVSMGCQRCESHKPVMAAVAEIKWWVNGMHIRVFFGPGLLAKEIRPRARCFRNPTHVMNCSYGVQLIAAVAAYSWLQLRRAVVGCSCGLLGLFRGSAGSVRSVSKLVPSVRGLRAAIHGLHHYPILAVICQAWPSVRGALRDANRGAGPRNCQ